MSEEPSSGDEENFETPVPKDLNETEVVAEEPAQEEDEIPSEGSAY